MKARRCCTRYAGARPRPGAGRVSDPFAWQYRYLLSPDAFARQDKSFTMGIPMDDPQGVECAFFR